MKQVFRLLNINPINALPFYLLVLASCTQSEEREEQSVLAVSSAENIAIIQAYSPEMVPGQSNAVAYMVIQNPLAEDRQILNVESDIASATEVHRHTYEDGVMKMRLVNHTNIPALRELAFQPGGYHIMLLGVAQPLAAGDSFEMWFEFDNGARVKTVVPVRSRK